MSDLKKRILVWTKKCFITTGVRFALRIFEWRQEFIQKVALRLTGKTIMAPLAKNSNFQISNNLFCDSAIHQYITCQFETVA